MPAPTVVTYAVAAIIDAHQALIDLIDGGAGAGKIIVLSAADVVLGEIPLDDPCGTINGTTGKITFDIAGPDTAADATGVIAYVQFANSSNVVYLSIPAEQGTTPVSGKVVFNTLAVTEDLPITMLAATIG